LQLLEELGGLPVPRDRDLKVGALARYLKRISLPVEKVAAALGMVGALVGGPKAFGQYSVSNNVVNFGALGDCHPLITVTCASNSTTVGMPWTMGSTNVGEVFILFGGGPATSGTNHQDLVTTIAGVSGTNVTLSVISSNTSPAALATYGLNNAEAFQACRDATPSNGLMHIPAGNYLMIDPQLLAKEDKSLYPALNIYGAGMSIVGAAASNTILTCCGAWQLINGAAVRGTIMQFNGSMSNNPSPIIISNLTFDGGVATGNTSSHGFPASTVDGSGWDWTTRAVADEGDVPPFVENRIISGCIFQHWRGEVLHGDVSYWSGNDVLTNSSILDFNADGYNFEYTHNITHCVFSNGFEALEFYEGYNSNACYFQDNLVTNITGNGLCICGALASRPGTNTPPYYFQNNLISVANGNAVETSAGQNVNIISNAFVAPTFVGIALGSAGQQGNAINSNIWVVSNNFSGVDEPFAVEGAGSDEVANVMVSNNTATGCGLNDGVQMFAQGYGYGTNVSFYGNAGSGLLYSGQMSGQWYYDDLSNKFPFYAPWYGALSNVVTYAFGARQQTSASQSNSLFALDDATPWQIPPNAQMIVSNSGYAAALYTSDTVSVSPIMMTNGYSATFLWTNGTWRLAGQTGSLLLASVSLSGANLVINGINGQSGGTYYVLTSTNLALPLNQWTPMATNIWSANGNFTFTLTNAVNPSVPNRFYLLQVK
jgi:hypothetical protein